MSRRNDLASGSPALLANITQGRRVWSRQANGFGAQLVSYAPRLAMERHAHRTANITVVLTGSFEEEIEGRDHSCDSLSVVVKPSGTHHATRVGLTETRTLVLEVGRQLEDELRRRFGLFHDCRWFPEASGLAPMVLHLSRKLSEGMCLTEGAMFDWFASFGAATRVPEGARGAGLHVRRALELLRRNPAVSTGDLARRLGLHPVYLARLFRERLGCTPGRIRQVLRLRTALDQIVRTDEPLAQVALSAGFADQSHLSRHLKRFAGLSPAAIRRLVSQI